MRPFKRSAEQRDNGPVASLTEIQNALSIAERELAECKSDMNFLVDQHQNGLVDSATYAVEIDRLDDRRMRLESAVLECKKLIDAKSSQLGRQALGS